MPNTSIAILTVESIHYIWDELRNKTLSITKLYLRAGTHRRTVTNEYLHLEDGQPAMTVGDGLIRDATIMGITANCETNHNWTVKIFRKGVITPLVTLTMAGENYKKDSTLNVDVPGGSVLLFKVEGINIPFPRVLLELAWEVTA
jgi:hypothetical protein